MEAGFFRSPTDELQVAHPFIVIESSIFLIGFESGRCVAI